MFIGTRCIAEFKTKDDVMMEPEGSSSSSTDPEIETF